MWKPFRSIQLCTVLLYVLVALCPIFGTASGDPTIDEHKPFTLASPAFKDGGTLPAEFTCDGARSSPPLEWSNAPAGTKFFAITMHHIPKPGDMHVYFVVYDIPAEVSTLEKDSKTVGKFGVNTVNGRMEYTPPCSKGPGPKKYTMTIYALSAAPQFDPKSKSVSMESLLAAIENTTLGKAELSVTYSRGEAPPRRND